MIAHAQRAHAKLAPSSAYRWLVCPGSVRLSEDIKETPSKYAAEGTAAHELAEKCLRGGFDAARFKNEILTIEGQPFKVDAEMVESVQLYLDVAREIQAESDEFEFEQKMNMSAIVPGVFGTGDVIAYVFQHPVSGKRRVTIGDLKYGAGVAVEVKDNEQELTYAVGVLQRYHNRGVDEVELVIVQPRAPHRDGPVRRWVTDVNTLYEHIMAMQTAAEAVARDDAPFTTGDHCKFCRAAAICTALKRRVEEIVMQDPATTPYRDWAAEVADIELVKGWARRREEYAHAEAMRGNLPPGSKLVGKRATRRWKDENAAVETLQMLGVPDDDIFESSVRSPAALEKLLPKKERAAIGALAVKASSGTVLAPLTDSRPAVDAHDASGFETHDTD